MRARVITMMFPTAAPGINPGCTEHIHSKFIKRKKYVMETLLPQVGSMGFPASTFPAVTDPDFVHDYKGNIQYKNWRLHFERGIVGCFLSHMMLWQECVDSDETLLIMEDDASLPEEHRDNISAAMVDYELLPDTGEILYLLGQLPYLKVGLHIFPNHTLTPVGALRRAYPVSDLSGTAAYAIKPVAARRLLDRAVRMALIPVDGFIHGAVNDREISVLVPPDHQHVFMLYEHFAPWNHIHEPQEVVNAGPL